MDFADISENDINYFLNYNGLNVNHVNHDKYLNAWNLLLANNGKEDFLVPISIYNFILKLNQIQEIINLHVLPEDIINLIGNSLDFKTLSNLLLVNKNMYRNEIIKLIISKRTGLDVSSYTVDELKNTYIKLRYGLQKISVSSPTFIIKDGKLYSNVILSKKYKKGFNFVDKIRKVNLNEKFVQVSNDLFLDKNGYVYKFGDYFDRFLLFERIRFTRRKKEDKFVKISANNYHYLLLVEDGQVGTGGINKYGQLAYRSNDFTNQVSDEQERMFAVQNYNIPDQFRRKFKDISAGRFHSLLLGDNGKVYSCGAGNKGQLGNNSKYNYAILQFVDISEEVYNLHAGNATSFVITITGKVYAFGNNDVGQLGLGDLESRYEPVLIPNLNHVIDIATGDYNTLFLTADGFVYGCGNNGRYLGREYNKTIPTKLPNVKNIIQLATRSEITDYGDYLYLDNEGNYSDNLNKIILEEEKPSADMNKIIEEKIGKITIKNLKDFIKKNNYLVKSTHSKDDLIKIAYKLITESG